MPMLKRADAEIHYEICAAGFPILLYTPGGLWENRDSWDAAVKGYGETVRKRDASISQQAIDSFGRNMFGGGPGGSQIIAPEAGVGTGSGENYRTICVRTCDGYYFPVSYSTTPASFAADEQTCQRMCPASETALYTHRNPGEDVAQALSSTGRP